MPQRESAQKQNTLRGFFFSFGGVFCCCLFVFLKKNLENKLIFELNLNDFFFSFFLPPLVKNIPSLPSQTSLTVCRSVVLISLELQSLVFTATSVTDVPCLLGQIIKSLTKDFFLHPCMCSTLHRGDRFW